MAMFVNILGDSQDNYLSNSIYLCKRLYYEFVGHGVKNVQKRIHNFSEKSPFLAALVYRIMMGWRGGQV